MIDAISVGGAPWQSISLSYDGPIPENPPSWMEAEHMVWFRDPCLLFKNMLDNPDFQNLIDYAPLWQYDTDDQHSYQNFVSGNWAWKQAVTLLIFVLHYNLLTYLLGCHCKGS